MSTEQEPKKSGKGTAKNAKATETVETVQVIPGTEPSAPEAQPAKAEESEVAVITQDELRVLTAGKIYAAYLRANPAFNGIVSPAWGPAAKRTALAFEAASAEHHELYDLALDIFCSALSGNPGYVAFVPEGLYRAAFAHAKSVKDAFKA